MRPTQIRMSGAPTGKAYMGWWGDMGSPAQKGIVQYTVSPFRQAPMKGLLKKYLFNGFRRTAGHFPYIAPPFAIGYAIYAYAKSVDAYHSSKEGHIAAMKAGGGHH